MLAIVAEVSPNEAITARGPNGEILRTRSDVVAIIVEGGDTTPKYYKVAHIGEVPESVVANNDDLAPYIRVMRESLSVALKIE